MFESLPNIHDDSSKHVPPVGISSIHATNDNTVQNENIKNAEIHLSLSTKELTGRQNNDTFCMTILKTIDEKKVSPDIFYD